MGGESRLALLIASWSSCPPLQRAVLGLVFTVAFLVVEVSLILVRYSKLDRLQDMRKKRKERRKEAARRKYLKTTTKDT